MCFCLLPESFVCLFDDIIYIYIIYIIYIYSYMYSDDAKLMQLDLGVIVDTIP